MPQRLKPDVRQRIVENATAAFADSGYAATTMSDIARAAGISTGNIYRYYENKDALFYEIVNESLVRKFNRLLRARVKALDGVRDIAELAPMSNFHVSAESFMEFCLEHRLQIVILLKGSEGTRYEKFADRMVSDLMSMAIAHFKALDRHLVVTPAMKRNLRRIYERYISGITDIFESSDDESVIRDLMGGYSAYHLAGLNAFFERPF